MSTKRIFLSLSSLLFLSACPGKDARRVNPILNTVPPQGRQTEFTPDERLKNEKESATEESAMKKIRFEKITNPIFYVLKKNEKTIYILGTVHQGVDYNELPSYVLDLLKRAKVSIHEANILEITPERVNPYVKLQEGQKLSSLISTIAFDNISKALAQEYRQDQIEQMTPWYASSKYSSACAKSSGKGPLDVQLEKFAQEAKVKSVPLEIFEVRMKEKKIEEWNRSLEISCWYIDSAFKTLLELYRTGDLQNTIKTAHSTGMEDPDQTEIFQRNRNWLPIILESIQSADTAFIYVGAAHLYGDESILSLLAREGFSAKRCSEKACP